MFTWDTNKAISNFEKHGISFEEAATIFVDENALIFPDTHHSKAEPRTIRIGRSIIGKILFVVYTIRRIRNEKEVVRIISARQASRKERQAYTGS